MELNLLSQIIVNWAIDQPIISRIHLYGSRVKGTYKADSDIDIAVEIITSTGDSSPLATWIAQHEKLNQSLIPLLSITPHLEWYANAIETPTIHKALNEASIVVYEH